MTGFVKWGTLVIATAFAIRPSLAQAQEGKASTPLAAQHNTEIPSGRNLARIYVQSPLVQMPVAVLDRSGQYVENLGRSDFHVLDNGVPQKTTRTDLALEPISLVIVVQTNEAVAPLLNQVRSLGPVLSSLLVGAQGKAAVISFGDAARIVQKFTSDADKLDQAFAHLTTEGTKSRLNDALALALMMLSESPARDRRVIVALAEGLDRGSETTRAEIIQAALGGEVSIYGLQFSRLQALLHNQQTPGPENPLDLNMARPVPPGRPQTPATNQTYNEPMNTQILPLISESTQAARGAASKVLPWESLLETYANYTGGLTYTHWNVATLQNQLSRVALDVTSQYMLAYVPSDFKQTGFHRIVVRIDQPDVSVRAPSGYFNMIKFLPATSSPR